MKPGNSGITLIVACAALLATTPAIAAQGDWIVKAGATLVDPKSDNLRIAEVGTLEVKNGTNLGLTVTYMATDHVGVELLAAVPFKHDIALKGAGNIGETKHLPPTLSVQYHFLPGETFSPYAGVGLNWTLFFDEKVAPGVADGLKLDDSTGLAAQVGADIRVNERWLVNVDLRYLDIDSTATLRVDGTNVRLGKVQIDPVVYSLMIGYRF